MTEREGDRASLAAGLYLVATPIGNLGDITQRALEILQSCDLIACEDTRISGKLLKHFAIRKPLISYHEHNEKQQARVLADKMAQGQSIALISDAGTPTLSDPGFRLVRECRNRNLHVSPIPGPSAAVAALSASGLPSDAFTYVGFLPAKSAARKRFFQEIQDASHTYIVFESNHRILKFLDDFIEILGSKRVISVARELTKLHETILTGPAGMVADEVRARSQKGEFVVIIAASRFEL